MYISNNVAEKIKILAKSKGISVKKLLEDVGLGFNTMSNMKTSMPKADNLAKIADYLDCSVDYLLGRTDIPEVNKGNTQKIIQLTEEYIANLQQEQSLESNITGAAASSTKKIHPKELAFEDLINIDTDDLS